MSERPSSRLSAPEELSLFVVNVLDYAVVLLSPDGEIRSWNAGATRIMGYEATEAHGRNFSIFYGPEDLARRKPENELRDAAEFGRIEDEGWRIRKDGTRFWANTTITALKNSDGSVRGYLKITRDLTERREAEEQLRRSEEMFRLLVDSVQDYAIFMLDPEGNINSWNHGAQRIKGYRPEEIIGRHFSVFYTPEDRKARKPERNLENAIRHGRFEEEGLRVRKDGTRFWANVVITAVHDDTGVLRGFAKVTRDVTARREAEETRRRLLEQHEARLLAEEEKNHAETAYRAASEANRAKDEFLMTLSHELRTPMTAILGWSRMLPAMKQGDPMFREAIQSIARSATLQAKLIDDVLDVSRIVSGKLQLSPENVEIVPILKASIDAVRPSAEARGIDLVSTFSPDVGMATVDPVRLQQIVWNLLANAVKFTPKGGRVELAASRTDPDLRIDVSDSGEGIDPEFLPHMFEPFRQAETPSTRVHGGLGLGLSIVRYLTEAHGGRVWAESDGHGKGARFSVALPIRAVQSGAPEEPSGPPVEESTPLSGRRILVVDDDREGRMLVATALRLAGADVEAVDSAYVAIEYLEKQRPDVVITDIAMPMMDGHTLRKEIRSREHLAGMKIVALTAFPPTKSGSDESDFDEYLRKPIDPYELSERIRQLLLRSA
ncbi:MAG: PAS domain S-box protein [Thermoanaerobaculia bacterium]